MNKELISFLLSSLLKKLTKLKNELKCLNNDLGKLMDDNFEEFKYNIYLKSLWEKEGEKSISILGIKDLRKGMHCAINNYKKENHRDDIQAHFYVYIVLPSGSELELPEKFWEHYRKSGEK
ncbi:hypothetical protein GW950_01475 [Candidatus Wolfebacteria bacterium]|nr:hypothetical protein [Candidatus Wolfebacteria bacterium]